MDYLRRLTKHFQPKKGWRNDPNGLVYFDGYYHLFYQYAPDFETPWHQPMHWGHARTKDFLCWEDLPIALYPDQPYDQDGCYSGTAIVKDGVLYLFYASIDKSQSDGRSEQTVSVAFSKDGIHFEKYARNPVIPHFPLDGGENFRDPAVAYIDGKYYIVMATGHKATKEGRLLLYESENLFDWNYNGIMSSWPNAEYTECPSFMQNEGGRCLLTASICEFSGRYFLAMYGDFVGGKFTVRDTGVVDKGPDQYAGQVFKDHKGRTIFITWIPGWPYRGWAEKDVGCYSVPREMRLEGGKVYGYPVEEVRHLLTDSDPAVQRTKDGFIIERSKREPVIHKGEIRDLKILRDAYILEVFVNGGECIYSVLL